MVEAEVKSKDASSKATLAGASIEKTSEEKSDPELPVCSPDYTLQPLNARDSSCKRCSTVGEGKAGSPSAPSIFGSEPSLDVSTSENPGFTGASPLCPSCGSSRTVHNGTRKLGNGLETPIWKCKSCNRKFSEKYLRYVPRGDNSFQDIEKVDSMGLKSADALDIDRQICVLETKNLSSVAENKTVTGGDEKDIKGLLLEYHVRMKLQGYKDSTIRLSQSILKTLMKRNADLFNPESVKEVMAKQTWSGNRKRNVIVAYTGFLTHLHLSWDPPFYEIIRKLPFIPTEQEIDDLIAGSSNVLAAFLQLLKETGMRRGEALATPWKDVDLERRVIMCNNPEKGSNPRIFSDLSGKLLNMLYNLPRENELLFGNTTMNMLKNQISRTRQKLAFKLGNPRLKEIHMHTFRYWKGTTLYHYKPDILYVAEFLGHRNIENTRLYIQLEKSLFKSLPSDQFITRIAHNVEEACKLIEVGFEFVTGEYKDGGKIFRKRK